MKSHMQLELMVKVFELFWIKIFLCYLLKKVLAFSIQISEIHFVGRKGNEPISTLTISLLHANLHLSLFFPRHVFRKVFDFK